MSRVAKSSIALGCLVAGLVWITACDTASGPPPLDTSALIGDWLEMAEPAKVNPRMGGTAGAAKPRRFLSIKPDNQWEFSIYGSNGAPGGAEGSAKGTWSVVSNKIVFTISDNSLEEDYKSWAPKSCPGLIDRPEEGISALRLETVDDWEVYLEQQ